MEVVYKEVLYKNMEMNTKLSIYSNRSQYTQYNIYCEQMNALQNQIQVQILLMNWRIYCHSSKFPIFPL